MAIPSSEEADEEKVVIEEEWTNEDGNNIFDLTYENNMVRSTMKNLFPDSDRGLIFDSYSTQEMTPLDMLYETNKNTPDTTADDDVNDDEENFKLDEFYDGTGSLVWLACIALCHLVTNDLVSPLAHGRRLPGGKNDSKQSTSGDEILQICELGCGTGLASIATLLASAMRKEADGKPLDRRVIFTDNDPEALELSEQNCELNQLDPESYDHQLLPWGVFPSDQVESELDKVQTSLKDSTMDVVLAADVIYDISMIPPLLQTAAWLLKPDGSLVVSHVPRFCLPKDEREQAEEQNLGDRSSPQQELEVHIIDQAKQVGLHLRETIRPHEALANIIDKDLREASFGQECQISCARLEQAHAVLFVFDRDRNAVD